MGVQFRSDAVRMLGQFYDWIFVDGIVSDLYLDKIMR